MNSTNIREFMNSTNKYNQILKEFERFKLHLKISPIKQSIHAFSSL